MAIKKFLQRNFRHFNAAALVDAAEGYRKHVEAGGKMFLSMAGAMSSAELGISLAEMIRKGKIHAICCTAANLEEDIYNLVAHEFYERVPHYRHLTAEDELALRDRGMNRVTDTCIPEEEAVRRINKHVFGVWKAADAQGKRYFPHEYVYQMLRSGELKQYYQIDPKDSWLCAAVENNIPLYIPGWEDSTLGNVFVAQVLKKQISGYQCMKSGLEYMASLMEWYQEQSRASSIGFFQIGGGIAGDFPICVVPTLKIDMEQPDTPFWGYFCQISDSTTSFGSYSGAVPNEKITWFKLEKDTPRFVIESDATIVAPLIFAYVLGQ